MTSRLAQISVFNRFLYVSKPLYTCPRPEILSKAQPCHEHIVVVGRLVGQTDALKFGSAASHFCFGLLPLLETQRMSWPRKPFLLLLLLLLRPLPPPLLLL